MTQEKKDDKQIAQLLSEQNVLLRQIDWKLWILTNAVCDALIKNGSLEKDPRT